MRLSLLCLLLALPLHADEPAWVAPMKDVHAKFKGTPGTLATFGDSITVTMAFWAPLQGEPKNMPDDMKAAHALVKDYMKPDCWSKWKGPAYGSNGGMTNPWPNPMTTSAGASHPPLPGCDQAASSVTANSTSPSSCNAAPAVMTLRP